MKPAPATRNREVRRLIAIFGMLYFVQGASEPTDGLVSQPLRSSLLHGGATPGEVARFLALVALPWALKPVYGIVVDLVPIAGSRRRTWLILSTALASGGAIWLAMSEATIAPGLPLYLVLLVPTFGIALGDVVTDAVMIETGQPLGITGVLQSAQWTSAYAATIGVGWIVGWLTEAGRVSDAFLLSAILSALGLVVAITMVREPPPPIDPPEPASIRGALGAGARPAVLRAALFLLLLAFNPFAALEYAHITVDLGMSDAHYGQTVSVFAAFAVVACLAYGWLAPRVRIDHIAHVALGSSVLATLALIWIDDVTSDFVVSIVSALAWTFAFLLQLDLAARVCPPRYAGTIFALLMAVSNGGDSLAAYVGGTMHDALSPSIGADGAYDVLVLMGAATTAVAWTLVPRLSRDHAASFVDPVPE